MEPHDPRENRRYRIADLTLCVGERRLSRGDEQIALSRLSFEFLRVLVEAAPNLVAHDELAARVWGNNRIITTENLAKRALMLRRHLGDHAEDPRYFEVVRGQGYRILPAVERLITAPDLPAAPPDSAASTRARRPAWPFVAAIVAVALAAVAITTLLRNSAPPGRAVLVELATAPEAPFIGSSYSRDIAISPDGTTIAFTSRSNSIVVQHLDSLQSRQIPLDSSDARNPTFSPDGQTLAFLSGGALKRVPANVAGPIHTLANVGQFTDGDIAWSSADSLLVANSRGLLQVSAEGGVPELLLVPDGAAGERSFGSPTLLPDHRTVLFSIEPTEPSYGSRVAAWNTETRRKVYLLNDAIEPGYLSSGHLTWITGTQLYIARFDVNRLEVAEARGVLADGIRVHTNGTAPIDVADDGTLVYVSGTSPPVRDLVWIDRAGRTETLPVPPMNYTYPRLSPLGTHILLDVRWPDSDIWVWDIEREVLVRVTNDPAENALPVWHPDGRQMAFGDGREGFANVYWHTLNSGTLPRRLTEGTRRQLPFSMSPDGRQLLIGEDQPDGRWNMWRLDLETQRRSELLSGPYSFWNTDISPDGRWLAYQSDESGELEVYVRPFPDTQDGLWKLSSAGGSKPKWSNDGAEIFYIDAQNWLNSVRLETFPDFVPAAPTRLFDAGAIFDQRYDAGARPYDLSADGQRFLFVRNVMDQTANRSPIVVGINPSVGTAID